MVNPSRLVLSGLVDKPEGFMGKGQGLATLDGPAGPIQDGSMAGFVSIGLIGGAVAMGFGTGGRGSTGGFGVAGAFGSGGSVAANLGALGAIGVCEMPGFGSDFDSGSNSLVSFIFGTSKSFSFDSVRDGAGVISALPSINSFKYSILIKAIAGLPPLVIT